MDFVEQLKQFSARLSQMAPMITTEEATKNALILPFFQMLGYDVFNPVEFVPEFTADVGIKKGEKVDFAVVIDGKPTILIEAKYCGEKLQNHDSQLFRYFATCNAKLAILTNGIVYRFYTDLDEPNKMDLTPFMEIDLMDVKDGLVPELKRFRKSALDVEGISDAASDLKYTNAVKALLARQASNPDEAFVNYIVREVYPGRRTPQVSEKFVDIIKRSFAQYFNDLLNERFKSMMEPKAEQKPADPEIEGEAESPIEKSAIDTTQEELEAFVIIKALVHDVIDVSRISHKDTASYFSILVDGKVTKWVCRLYLSGRKKSIVFPAKDDGKDERFDLSTTDDLYQYREQLAKSVADIIDG